MSNRKKLKSTSLFNPVTDVPLEMWQHAVDQGEMFNGLRPDLVVMMPLSELDHAEEIEINDGGHILQSHMMFGAYDPPEGGVVVAVADHVDPKFMKRRIGIGYFATVTNHRLDVDSPDMLGALISEAHILAVVTGNPSLMYKSFYSIEEYIAAHGASHD